jgi:predicted nucleic acid-binding Zn ribbon protein
MANSKRKFEPQLLGKVLSEIIESKALYRGITNEKINGLWNQLLGDNISQFTNKVELRNETLYVSLKSATLREELSYGKGKIMRMLNEEMGKETIKKIILR